MACHRSSDSRGSEIAAGSTTANWQSGTATSGATGGDLVTVGGNGSRYILHSLLVNLSALTTGAVVTIRYYMQINGTERRIDDTTVVAVVGTTPDGVWVVNGSVGIHEALRVEVQSNTAGDNATAIDYDYMLEAI